jgi:hypothetical protein
MASKNQYIAYCKHLKKTMCSNNIVLANEARLTFNDAKLLNEYMKKPLPKSETFFSFLINILKRLFNYEKKNY